MTIRSVQKVIKIGDSAGVTIPAKDIKYAGIKVGDEVEISIKSLQPRSRKPSSEEDEVIKAAKSLLKRYKKDFDNLANR